MRPKAYQDETRPEMDKFGFILLDLIIEGDAKIFFQTLNCVVVF